LTGQGALAVRCRLAGCREALDDGKAWSFYLINDGEAALDWAALDEVAYEWGDVSSRDAATVRLGPLAPGAHARLWRDDGSGAELRMTFHVRAGLAGAEVRLQFEFPKLYRLRELPEVPGLGRRGWQVAAEARANRV
jgi:hypothetical protein